VVFFIGVAAAVAVGLGYALEQRIAAQAPLSEILSFRLLLDLVRRRLWLIGLGCTVLGQALAAWALDLASVALVESLLSSSLLFAFGFAAGFWDRRLRWSELGGALLLCGAVSAFIVVGNPRSSRGQPLPPALIALALGVVAGVVLVLVVVARRLPLTGEAVALAAAAGVVFGTNDATIRQMFVDAKHGVGHALVTPWPYLVAVTGMLGLLLSQSAFKAARLDFSLPALAAAEPLTGIGLGVAVLGDRVSASIGSLAVEAACVVAMVAGVVVIGRSAAERARPTHVLT
jgi:drug/metabolite transporter (DMT)-like permease